MLRRYPWQRGSGKLINHHVATRFFYKPSLRSSGTARLFYKPSQRGSVPVELFFLTSRHGSGRFLAGIDISGVLDDEPGVPVSFYMYRAVRQAVSLIEYDKRRKLISLHGARTQGGLLDFKTSKNFKRLQRLHEATRPKFWWFFHA